MTIEITPFYDPTTFTLTYVVHDPESRDAIVVDPVLDYDPLTSAVSTKSIEPVLAHVERERLKIHWVLETHAHADHLSAAQVVKKKLGARIAVGRRITEVQRTFKDVFDLGEEFPTDGSQFDRLLSEGERVEAGTLVVGVIATPGHTPACVTYRIEDADPYLILGACNPQLARAALEVEPGLGLLFAEDAEARIRRAVAAA